MACAHRDEAQKYADAVRIRIIFKNVSDKMNICKILYLIDFQNLPNVANMIDDISKRFNLKMPLLCSVDDYKIPAWQSTKIFREDDIIT